VIGQDEIGFETLKCPTIGKRKGGSQAKFVDLSIGCLAETNNRAKPVERMGDYCSVLFRYLLRVSYSVDGAADLNRGHNNWAG